MRYCTVPNCAETPLQILEADTLGIETEGEVIHEVCGNCCIRMLFMDADEVETFLTHLGIP